MSKLTRKSHLFLQLAAVLFIFTAIASVGLAQEAASSDSRSTLAQTFRPRHFLLSPPPSIYGQDAYSTSNETREDAASGSSSAQGGLPGGLPIKTSSKGRNAPRRVDFTSINFGPKHINALFGGFEQGGGIGFGVELTTADKLPGIEFRARAMVSTRLYRKFELSAYFPKIGDDKTHADIWFTYMRRTRDTFFGLGPRSNKGDRTNFDNESRSIEGIFYRDFSDNFQAGIYLGRTNTSSYRGQNDDEPAIDVLFSGNPNVVPITNWVPGLLQQLKFFSYGAFAELDARNDDRGLTRGGYLYGRLISNDGLNNNYPTTYGWTEGQIDGRVYVPIFSDKTSFAFRAMADLQSPKGGSQIPFWANTFLGGRSFLRGFTNFRFRSHNLLLFSSELRQTVYAMGDDRGVDIAFFGDLGRSWGDTRSKTNALIIRNDRFGDAPWRAAYGPAFQFRYNKDLAIRVDLGHSPERTLLYFSISRGF